LKKKKRDLIKNFHLKINENNTHLPTNFNNQSNDINTNSWFDIKKYNALNNNNHSNRIKINTKFKKKKIIKCVKIKMLLNKEQKEIIHKWFDAYTKMYNEALKYIRSKYIYTKNDITRDILVSNLDTIKQMNNFINIRNELKDIKNTIMLESQLENTTKNTKIQSHNLDYAIRQLCSNIESAKTNLIRNNIKKFRIKFWRNNRISKTLEIEQVYIRKDNLCPKILGDIDYYYNGILSELCNIDSNVKINYNKISDEYILLVPEKMNNKPIININNKIVSLDPGLRTFMSGVSENSYIKIGNNVNSIISKPLQRLNNIKNNENISSKIKKKNEILINRKIKNKIDDLHWKTINYLVKNYKTILLGDMSAKSIVSRNKNIINNIQKVACLRTKYYEFCQRLKFKCELNDVNFSMINEAYTSKTCSNCGYYKDNLGSASVYNCNKCHLNIDRDINGARNIYIKSLI